MEYMTKVCLILFLVFTIILVLLATGLCLYLIIDTQINDLYDVINQCQ